MPNTAALSATTATGLFTLLGTLAGALVGGTLTICLEILRRRWHENDASRDNIKELRAAEYKERKELYPLLLAKGMEFDYFIMSIYIVKRPEPLTIPDGSSSTEITLKALSKVLPGIAPIMREFESLRARSEMVADTEVQHLINKWDKFLSDRMGKVVGGYMTLDNDDENPYESLIQAMRTELATVSGNEVTGLSVNRSLTVNPPIEQT